MDKGTYSLCVWEAFRCFGKSIVVFMFRDISTGDGLRGVVSCTETSLADPSYPPRVSIQVFDPDSDFRGELEERAGANEQAAWAC